MHPLDKYLHAFLVDSYSSVENIRSALKFLSNEGNEKALFEIMRLFHSMNSSSSMMGFTAMSSICNTQEMIFKAAYKLKQPMDSALKPNAMDAVEKIHALLKKIEKEGADSLRA